MESMMPPLRRSPLALEVGLDIGGLPDEMAAIDDVGAVADGPLLLSRRGTPFS
jgi:hypothetical protein